MKKQDRQGVRKPSDIEQKYDLSLLEELDKGGAQQREEFSKFNQAFSQFSANVTARLQILENMMLSVGSLHITLSEVNPSGVFGGEWELVAEGHILVGLESEDELPEVFQGSDKCFIWKRIS
jgi:hypothetical protein